MAWSIQKKILVPFDFSDHSHTAVDKALELAADRSQVHILHVLPNIIPVAVEGFAFDAVDDQVRIEVAQSQMDTEFQDERYSGVKLEVLIGDPGTVCADQASALQAELIVLPSHGRSGITRLLLGSVAEHIIRMSQVPVLVLKI